MLLYVFREDTSGPYGWEGRESLLCLSSDADASKAGAQCTVTFCLAFPPLVLEVCPSSTLQ
jgi:hypothetical protein